jgi:hypothetical protein
VNSIALGEQAQRLCDCAEMVIARKIINTNSEDVLGNVPHTFGRQRLDVPRSRKVEIPVKPKYCILSSMVACLVFLLYNE